MNHSKLQKTIQKVSLSFYSKEEAYILFSGEILTLNAYIRYRQVFSNRYNVLGAIMCSTVVPCIRDCPTFVVLVVGITLTHNA